MAVGGERGRARGLRDRSAGRVRAGSGRERNILGELRGERRKIGCLGEVGVPAVKVGGELIVEDPGSDLKE